MSAADQNLLVDFINSGKGVYWEGTNIASDHESTTLWNMFGASNVGTGPDNGDVVNLIGNANTFADGLTFGYSPYGEYSNARVNRLNVTDGTALLDSDNSFTRVVYNDTGAGRVIASSIIFGGIYNEDVVSTRSNLMASYLSYLLNIDIPVAWTSEEMIDFETLLPGTETMQTLYLRNLGMEMLELSDIQLSGSNFVYQGEESYSLDFGHYVELPVIFPCDVEGEFSEILSINTNDPDNPLINVSVTGSCYSAPQISVDASDFNVSVGMGNSMETSLTISNTGGGYLDYYIETLNVTRGSGGPDNFGYTWIDSNDPEGPVYEWFDISTIGIDGELSGVDDYITVELPIPFPFYGEMRSEIKISTNGYLTFGNDPVDHSNDPIPFAMDPNDYIAAIWDDLRTGGESMLYTYFDEDSNRFVIQYQDWKFYTGGGTGDLDFQIQLYPNGDIFYYYDNLEGSLTSATVGIENQDASDGLQIVYNNEYLENQLAVKISPNPTWMELDNYSGSVFQDEPVTIGINVDASNLNEGVYNALIKIHNSDEDNDLIEIPVELTVTATASEDEIIPHIPALNQNYPNPFNLTAAGRGPVTTIDFFIPDDGISADIVVYNMKGQAIVTLARNQYERGYYSVHWDGKDSTGNEVSAGIYFYKLTTDRHSQTKKMILMK